MVTSLFNKLNKLSTDVTHLSIGLIIKGIALSPTIVVIHIWALGGTPLAYLLRVNLDAAQILLIVTPARWLPLPWFQLLCVSEGSWTDGYFPGSIASLCRWSLPGSRWRQLHSYQGT